MAWPRQWDYMWVRHEAVGWHGVGADVGPTRQLAVALEQAGDHGWELAGVEGQHRAAVFYFKRPRPAGG